MDRQRDDCLGWMLLLKHRRKILRLRSGSDTHANSFSKPNRHSYGDGDSNSNGCGNGNAYGYTHGYSELYAQVSTYPQGSSYTGTASLEARNRSVTMKTKTKPSAYILRGSTTALLFSCVIVALCSAINLPEQNPKVLPPQDNAGFGANRPLTFVERVAYQRAIEDVYWRHRIWPNTNRGPKPSLDAVMSQAQVEKKVTDYLRNSQALEDHWQRPITADQLQAETERMASNTKQPDVLQELFEALGNDPFVIAECLARPLLTEHLIADVAVVAGVPPAPRKSFAADTAASTENRIRVTANVAYTLPVIASPSGGCIDDTWTPTTLTNAPSPRSAPSVWTGSEMIVWSGGTGGRYNPITDSWTATSTVNAPTGGGLVWTGSEMIAWGGGHNTGGRYNPITDSWIATSTTNAPSARDGNTAVWTGSEMIVWGGLDNNGDPLNTGGRYNPVTDSWTATSTTNAPSARTWHTAVWTESEMIVWGGCTDTFCGGIFSSGGGYNPVTDSWTATSTTNAPDARGRHTAVWTDSEMIIWGGTTGPGGTLFNTGGRYNPGADSWTATTSTTNAPDARFGHSAVWTGSEMIVWGGYAFGPVFNTGGRYNPVTDSWTPTSTTGAPVARWLHTAVWADSEQQMIVWGGLNVSGNALNSGGRYCAAAGGPTPTPTPSSTPTATATATVTATATATPTTTATPTATASSSPSPSTTPRSQPTPRARPTPAPRP